MAKLIEENFIDHFDIVSELNPMDLYIITGLSSHMFDIEDLAYSIDYYYKKKNKRNIIFADYLEAPNPVYINLMNKVCDLLISKYGYKKDIFIYATGFILEFNNADKLNLIYENHGIIPTIVKSHLYFELEWSYIINNPSKPDMRVLENRGSRNKKFLMFTGSRRPHRVYLLYHIIKNKLDDQGYFSILHNKQDFYEFFKFLNPRNDDDPYMKQIPDMKTTFENYPRDFPIHLSSTLGDNPSQHILSDIDVKLFADSYFSIIPETSFYKRTDMEDGDNHWNFHLDFTFVTEKTFRAIAALHPFVLASRPNTLKALRDIGYQTFHPYIDESYDDIQDDDLRLEKICEVINKLCNKTDQEWLQFQKDTFPIVKHNQEVLSKAYPNFKRLCK